jgi:NADPH2:quinone reductase
MAELMLSNKGLFGYSVQILRMQRSDWYREDLQALMRLCAEGTIKPVIGQILALEEAATAHRLLGVAEVTGKIVLHTSQVAPR